MVVPLEKSIENITMKNTQNITYESIHEKQKPMNVITANHPVDTFHCVQTLLDFIEETINDENINTDVVLNDCKQESLYYIIKTIKDAIQFESGRAKEMMNDLYERTMQ